MFRLSPATVFFAALIVVTFFVNKSRVFADPPFTPPGQEKRTAPVPTSTPTLFVTPSPRPATFFSPVTLSDGPLVVCQAHERVIKTRMDNLVRFTNNIFEVFTNIATRVEDFYKLRVLPMGRTVSNYDMLINDISVKQAVVKSDVNIAQDDSNSFSCTATSPKARLTQFRMDMQTVKDALKDYRTSIKNLIVAVRGSATQSATPTLTPAPSL